MSDAPTTSYRSETEDGDDERLHLDACFDTEKETTPKHQRSYIGGKQGTLEWSHEAREVYQTHLLVVSVAEGLQMASVVFGGVVSVGVSLF